MVQTMIDREVREHLFSLIEGSEDLSVFTEWFVGATWDERTPLVTRIDHLLVEGLPEADLREELHQLASTYMLGDVPTVLTAQSATTMILEFRHVAPNSEVTGSQTYRGRLAFSGR